MSADRLGEPKNGYLLFKVYSCFLKTSQQEEIS